MNADKIVITETELDRLKTGGWLLRKEQEVKLKNKGTKVLECNKKLAAVALIREIKIVHIDDLEEVTLFHVGIFRRWSNWATKCGFKRYQEFAEHLINNDYETFYLIHFNTIVEDPEEISNRLERNKWSMNKNGRY